MSFQTTIVESLKTHISSYTIDEFKDIISRLHDKTGKDIELIKNTVSTYASVLNSYIVFDLTMQTKQTYNELRSKYKEAHACLDHDDVITPIMLERAKKVKKLSEIEYPEQRSEAWFALRNDKITASDAGCVINDNKYEPPYKMIIKKVFTPPFINNHACSHGKKYEAIAIMIYEKRYNVRIMDFGLIAHPTISCLAASPDGIVSEYKYNNKHKTSRVGRMVEIKCPVSRKILAEGEVKGEICPIYYWDQVQLQLECCDLDECDFWQCGLEEYESREEYINDTNKKNPFISDKTGLERGCIIQLLPKNKTSKFINDEGKINHDEYLQVVYELAQHRYPPSLNMTIQEYDTWVTQTTELVTKTNPELYVDKIIYWKLINSGCNLIIRDIEWFNKTLPLYKQMWKYIEVLRKDKAKAEQLELYIKSVEDNVKRNYSQEMKKKQDDNNKIMEFVEKITKN
jgi:putative phage-type endonuclease